MAARAYDGFRGQSWMDVSLSEPWVDLYGGQGEGGGEEEGMEWREYA